MTLKRLLELVETMVQWELDSKEPRQLVFTVNTSQGGIAECKSTVGKILR